MEREQREQIETTVRRAVSDVAWEYLPIHVLIAVVQIIVVWMLLVATRW